MPTEEQKAKVKEMLQALDKDNSGFLDHEELKTGMLQIYAEMDFKCTDEDVTKMMESVDKDQDGKVNLEEFMKIIS